MIYNNLPVYEAKVDDEGTGIMCVSLVTDPATQVDFVTFKDEKEMQKFAIDNKSEHIVKGVIMVADTPIYRRTETDFEYYIIYSKETLKLMAEKMIMDGVGSKVNIQHQDGTDVEGVNLMELFVIDRENGISPSYFSEVPDGSLIGSYKVNNEEVWGMIEAGDVLSFSLEGIFNVEETFNKQSNDKTTMKINRIKELARRILCEFGEVATDKGILVWDGDEDLKSGHIVRIMDTEGNETAAEDGEYVTDDNKTIVVVDGKVAEIRDPEAEVEPEDEPNPQQENAPEDNPNPEENAPEAEQEPDEKDARIKELEAEIEEKDARIAELEAKVAELEKEPAGENAQEAFRKQKEKTVDKDSATGKMRSRGYRF